MTTNTISTMADKWWPLPVDHFFTPQRAPDMWFGDELPPTVQALMLSPMITQAKAMAEYQITQSLAVAERQHMIDREQRRRTVARSRVGKRAKSSRH